MLDHIRASLHDIDRQIASAKSYGARFDLERLELLVWQRDRLRVLARRIAGAGPPGGG